MKLSTQHFLLVILIILVVVPLILLAWLFTTRRHSMIKERCTAFDWDKNNFYQDDCYGKIVLEWDSAWEPQYGVLSYGIKGKYPISVASIENLKQFRVVGEYFYVIDQDLEGAYVSYNTNEAPHPYLEYQENGMRKRMDFVNEADIPPYRKINTKTGDWTMYKKISEAPPQDQIIFRELEKLSKR